MPKPKLLSFEDVQDLRVPEILRSAPAALLDFDMLGKGANARVFVNRSRPDVVIRIGRAIDGWVGYALSAQGAAFAPRLDALCYFEGFWVCLTERLTPTPSPFRDIVEALVDAAYDDPDFAHVLKAEIDHPGLTGFCRDHLVTADDIREPNLMMRGTQLVFNDPYCAPEHDIRALIDAWSAVPACENPFGLSASEVWHCAENEHFAFTAKVSDLTGWGIVTVNQPRADFPVHTAILTPDRRLLDAYGAHSTPSEMLRRMSLAHLVTGHAEGRVTFDADTNAQAFQESYALPDDEVIERVAKTVIECMKAEMDASSPSYP